MMPGMPKSAPAPYRIAVVCSGNTCRSPMAEVVLRGLLVDAGVGDRFAIESFGTGDWHVGEHADPRTQAVLMAHGYDVSAHRARLVPRDLLATHDLVLFADAKRRRKITRKPSPGARAEVRLLRESDPEAVAAGTLDLEDPYYGTMQDYERCFEEVLAACGALADELIVRP